jgi:hypothetical protein
MRMRDPIDHLAWSVIDHHRWLDRPFIIAARAFTARSDRHF